MKAYYDEVLDSHATIKRVRVQETNCLGSHMR